MSRQRTTGRFETREELERYVRTHYHNSTLSMAGVARICRVSPATVAAILGSDPQAARARMIAAAPDLLLAVESMLNRTPVSGNHPEILARAALSKATGGRS